ncbi:MAG: hypothetical protein ACHP7N_18945 [Caulobacterales bacterium]
MRRRLMLAPLGLAASLLMIQSGPATAQLFGHKPPPRSQSGPQQVDCNMVAANPNSGMDKASCESMNQAAAAYYASQHDPSASKPGDESMTCEEIKAEFMQQPITPPPAQQAAQSRADVRNLQGKIAVEEAHAAAAEAAGTAENVAASALSAANPLAGRAAQEAANAQQAATQSALNAEAKATVLPAQRKVNSDTAAMVGGMTSQMQSNPRIGRLVALANEKHCHGF